ncbi:MAG: MsnO8 family LLM class oxidoreductase [Campylobacterota bacterium]
MLKLSVLDQSPIHDGKEAKQGLFDTIKLAKLCEELGYHRYLLAEHHDTPGYASSSPEIMIGAIAANTSKIRVGSGGVMLNHYSSFKVAETFNTLSALYDNRIDLGVGRASGGSYLATRALHTSFSDYSKKAYDLINFLDGTTPKSSEFSKLHLCPIQENSTPVYLLGSSNSSSSLAGVLGVGFILALFIGIDKKSPKIFQDYKNSFNKSQNFKKPKASIAVACIVAEDKEEAQYIASSHTFWKLQAFKHPKRDGLQTPQKVQELLKNLSYEDRQYYKKTMNSMILGNAKECKEQIEKLALEYEVDEVIVVNVTYSFEHRKRSYELLAKEFKLNKE